MNYWIAPGIKKDKFIQVDKLFESIEKYMGINKNDILSKRRHREIVEARYIFAYICKNQTNWTWRTIGEYINRDHSCTIHYVNTAGFFLQHDKKLNKLYSLILNSIC